MMLMRLALKLRWSQPQLQCWPLPYCRHPSPRALNLLVLPVSRSFVPDQRCRPFTTSPVSIHYTRQPFALWRRLRDPGPHASNYFHFLVSLWSLVGHGLCEVASAVATLSFARHSLPPDTLAPYTRSRESPWLLDAHLAN